MAIFDFSKTTHGAFIDAQAAEEGDVTISVESSIKATHRTTTSFQQSTGGIAYAKYTGEHFAYNGKGQPVAGIMHKMEAIVPGHPDFSYTISELSIDIAAGIAAALSPSTADDKAYALSMFQGNSTYKFGSGNDHLASFGGNDKIYGNNGKDTLGGGTGKDTIEGGNGNDNLDGGKGNDVLKGDAGSDKFVFKTALGASNIDTIKDFDPTADTIGLSHSIFAVGVKGATLAAALFGSTAGSNGIDSNDKILYDQATGKLSYDANGGSHADAVQFAMIANHAHLTSADFLMI